MTLVLVVFAPQVSSLMAPEEAFEKTVDLVKFMYLISCMLTERKPVIYDRKATEEKRKYKAELSCSKFYIFVPALHAVYCCVYFCPAEKLQQ
jgi:hypothetical protein